MDEWKQNQQAEKQQHDRTWAHRMHSINNNVCSSTLCLLLLWLYSFYHNFRSTAKEKRYACLFALNRIVVACTMVVCLHILSNHNQCTNCWKQKKNTVFETWMTRERQKFDWTITKKNSLEILIGQVLLLSFYESCKFLWPNRLLGGIIEFTKLISQIPLKLISNHS